MKRTVEKHWIEQLVENIASGAIPPDTASATLLYELGRGGRIVVVDENLRGLAGFLSGFNYTAYGVPSGFSDARIKAEILDNKVFITQNGKDFCRKSDLIRYDYGLIWVVSAPPLSRLSVLVKDTLMGSGFRKNLHQVIKI